MKKEGQIESGNGKQIHIEEEIMKQNEGIYWHKSVQTQVLRCTCTSYKILILPVSNVVWSGSHLTLKSPDFICNTVSNYLSGCCFDNHQFGRQSLFSRLALGRRKKSFRMLFRLWLLERIISLAPHSPNVISSQNMRITIQGKSNKWLHRDPTLIDWNQIHQDMFEKV